MRVFATTFALAVAAALALYIWGDRFFTPVAAPGTPAAAPASPIAAAATPYTLGTVVKTAELKEQPRPYLGEGWSVTEDWGVWTDGAKATMTIPIKDAVTGDLTFAVNAVPFFDEVAKKQLITISAGGTKVGEWLFSSADQRPDRVVTIPQSAVSSGKLDLTFDLPDAAKPQGGDRTLALGLKTFVLSKVAP